MIDFYNSCFGIIYTPAGIQPGFSICFDKRKLQYSPECCLEYPVYIITFMKIAFEVLKAVNYASFLKSYVTVGVRNADRFVS